MKFMLFLSVVASAPTDCGGTDFVSTHQKHGHLPGGSENPGIMALVPQLMRIMGGESPISVLASYTESANAKTCGAPGAPAASGGHDHGGMAPSAPAPAGNPGYGPSGAPAANAGHDHSGGQGTSEAGGLSQAVNELGLGDLTKLFGL